jgi:hypothetical protein
MISLLVQERNDPQSIEAHGDIVQELHLGELFQAANTRKSHFDTTGSLQFSEYIVTLANEPLPAKSSPQQLSRPKTRKTQKQIGMCAFLLAA